MDFKNLIKPFKQKLTLETTIKAIATGLLCGSALAFILALIFRIFVSYDMTQVYVIATTIGVGVLSSIVASLIAYIKYYKLTATETISKIDSLGLEREIRKVKGKENVSEIAGGDSYYLVEEVKTYKNNPKTRVFTNLVESAVESLLCDLQIELYQMLVSNNIGKCKEDVQRYVKDRITHIIGIIRNNLCDVYNQLSNENLFDTHQYWKEIGITYPEDWIQDQIVHLLVNCMKIRYSDFDV